MVAKPYHHGQLRAVVLAAAVEEVEAVGAEAVSLREIARRAGVSHAAPAHHFRDKTGLFTAIATEGFALAAASIAPAATGRDRFVGGGAAYVAFALTHPGHFEVMFRPNLYDGDDPGLVEARDAAFAILFDSAAHDARGTDDVTGLVLAGWSMAHGFATLWRTANLQQRLEIDPAEAMPLLLDGTGTPGRLARRFSRTAATGRSG